MVDKTTTLEIVINIGRAEDEAGIVLTSSADGANALVSSLVRKRLDKSIIHKSENRIRKARS